MGIHARDVQLPETDAPTRGSFRHTRPGTAAAPTRRGFTVVEMVVVLALLAALAAVVVPTVLSRIREGEASSLAKTVDALREGVLEYRADVRRFPSHLRYLSTAPGSATDICGRSVPGPFLARWKGPYVNRTVTTDGLRVGNATVLDSVARSPETFTASTTGQVFIRVEQVDSAVARHIEREHDTILDFADGTIRWTNVAAGRGILELAIPVRGC